MSVTNRNETKKCNKQKTIEYSVPGRLFELLISLNEGNCSKLQTYINIYLQDECDAKLVFLDIVNAERKEAFIEAIGKNVMPKKLKHQVSQCLSDVLNTKSDCDAHVKDLPSDVLEIISSYLLEDSQAQAKSIILCPIIDKPFTVIVCIVGFSVNKEKVKGLIRECFLFCWPVLKKSICLDYETTLKEKCQQLLKMTRLLFSQVTSLDMVLRVAMDQARLLTKAAFCVILLVDTSAMQLVDPCSMKPLAPRSRMDVGITGLVLKIGMPVNVKDCKSHPLYDPAIDGYPGVESRNLLFFPIRDKNGILGVGQLINKVHDPYFDALDEELCMALSIFCGACIVESTCYQRVDEFRIRNTLANELVMYHMKVSDSEIARIMQCPGPHNHPQLASLYLNPQHLKQSEFPCYVYNMFFDLGFVRKFNIKRDKLAGFILYTQRGYRDVPYHNWNHAFSVAQWAYASINHYKLLKLGYLTELQGFMYLVAALVHDLDHRGDSNVFELFGGSTLGSLYSGRESIMEYHHLQQAIAILNNESCNILENLKRYDYDTAILLLRDYVLATDPATFHKNLQDYKTLSLNYQKDSQKHGAALRSLLIIAANFSDQLKTWSIVKKNFAALLTECFEQKHRAKKLRGTKENNVKVPAEFSKCFIPDLAIQFLSTTCGPLFDILCNIFPNSHCCCEVIKEHLLQWEASKHVFAELPYTAGLSILLSPGLDNLIENHLKKMQSQRPDGSLTIAEECEQ